MSIFFKTAVGYIYIKNQTSLDSKKNVSKHKKLSSEINAFKYT